MEEVDKYRMYGLVPYNISPIQQGIQFGHALQEYNNKLMYGEVQTLSEGYTTDFQRWRNVDKTFIILNGGTSMTMEQHVETLSEAGIVHATFREPDLNDMVSGIVFLVPEQVYKREEYPRFKEYVYEKYRNEVARGHREWKKTFDKETYPKAWEEWTELIGGEKNAFLIDFTSQFNLA